MFSLPTFNLTEVIQIVNTFYPLCCGMELEQSYIVMWHLHWLLERIVLCALCCDIELGLVTLAIYIACAKD